MCVCARARARVLACMSTGGKKSALNPMELVLQEMISQPTWLLGTELGFSTRSVHALKHRVI